MDRSAANYNVPRTHEFNLEAQQLQELICKMTDVQSQLVF